MTVFKIYINGISDSASNLVFRSDHSTTLTGYGDFILSPKLKKETNKADSFEFIILPGHSMYDSFEKKKTPVYLTRDGKCIFRGRVSDIKTDIYKQRTISCEGDLAFLGDSVLSPNKKSNTSTVGSTKKQKNETVYSHGGGEPYTANKDLIKMTPEEYFRQCINAHNGQCASDQYRRFTVGTVNVTDSNKTEYFERTSYQDTSSTISSDLLSVYGGVLRTRYENGQAYIDWLDAYTEANSQQIKFGVNMIDLDQEPPTDEYWSVLLPTGEDNCTIAAANNGNKFLENNNAIAKYGYIVHHHSFSNVKKSEKLLEKAQKYMATHCKLFPNNLIVKAIDLQLIGESDDPLELGDKIKVVSSPHGLSTAMACIAMELDIFNPENNSYTIGTILPPDKEKKKEPISEKHKNSHHSASRGIANNANAISGLQNDVNVNANNINVNAENIAVNALNIAVNAENIAVVAKNIAIAAETIDIKAQEITATFGEETDDLYGHITASAEGIKTEFHDNTTGLSSYFSQEAGKIMAAVESADGNIRSKIELTESSLISQFNTTIYGENGVVEDYEGKITQTSTSLTSDYTAKITNAKTELTQDYEGKITQSATSLTSDYTAKITNAKTELTQDYEGKITQSATSLISDYTAKITNAKTEVTTAYESKISQTATSINTEVSKKVGKTEVISSINQTAEEIKINASKINLSGYVTASQLSTTNASITNLMNGTTTASYILATKMKVASGNFYLGDSNNTSGKLYYHGTEYYDLTVTMPGVTGSFDVLGWTYKNSSYPTSFSLAHSHSVTTNSNGTITIGGSVATDANSRSDTIDLSNITLSSIQSNRIDAYENLYVGSAQNTANIYINGTQYAGGRKITFLGQTRYVLSRLSDWGDSVQWNLNHSHSCTTNNDGTITLGGAVTTANAGSFKIADTKAYKDGVSAAISSVTIDSLGRNSDYDDSYDTTTHNTTVYIKATASNGYTRSNNFTVSGSSAYNAGYSDGYPDANSWTIPFYSSTYDREMVAVADDDDGIKDCVTFKVKYTDIKGHDHTHNFSKIPCWDVYNNGRNSVTIDSLERNPNYSDSYNSSTHDTTVYIKATASNGYTRSNNFTVSGSSAYADGKSSVTIDSIGRNPNHSDSYNTTTHDTTVYIKATASNDYTRSTNFTVSGSSAYADGRSSVDPSTVIVGELTPTTGGSGRNDEASSSVYVSASNGHDKTYTISHITAWKVFEAGMMYALNTGITCTEVRVYNDGTAALWLHCNDYSGNDHSRRIDLSASQVKDYHT